MIDVKSRLTFKMALAIAILCLCPPVKQSHMMRMKVTRYFKMKIRMEVSRYARMKMRMEVSRYF